MKTYADSADPAVDIYADVDVDAPSKKSSLKGQTYDEQVEALSPGAAQTKAEADKLAANLETERDAKRVEVVNLDDRIRSAQNRLDQLSPEAKERTELEARLAELKTKREAAATAHNEAIDDLAALRKPGASTAELNKLLAKRDVAVSTDADKSSSGTGWQLGDGGIKKSSEATATNMAAGNVVTTKKGESREVGIGTVKDTQVESTSVAGGGASSSKSKVASQALDVTKGSYTTAVTESEVNEDEGGKDVTTRGKSTTVGPDGVTTVDSKSTQVGDQKISEKNTSAVTRGDGKIGKKTSSEKSTGTVDGDGNMVKGTTDKTSVDKGVIAGADGVGGYAGADAERTTQHSKGVKTGMSAGANGSFVVNVKSLGGDPEKFAIVLTISVGAKLGASASAEGEHANTGAKGNVGGSISGNASGKVTFQKVLDAEAAKAYLESIGKAEKGTVDAKHPELGILKTAVNEGPAAAKAAADQVKATMGSAEGAKAMADGDSVTIEGGAGVDGKANAGGSSGGLSLGVEGGVTASTAVKLTISKVKGKMVLTASVDDKSGWSAGGTGGMGAASMGGTYGTTGSTGASVTLTVDETDPDYGRILADLRGATSQEELQAIQAKWASKVSSTTKSKGEEDTLTTKAGVGPVGVEIGQSAGTSEKVTTDKDGKVTREVEGHNSLGGSVSVLGLKAGSSEKEAFASKVGPDGQVTGDVSETKSETDVGKSLQKLADNVSNDPIGVLTGSAKSAEESTNVSGLEMTDSDFTALMARARSKSVWMSSCPTPRLRDDWAQCRLDVLKAGKDKQAVAAALASFMGKFGHKRDEVVQAAVRDHKSGQGGIRYEFPDGLAKLKPQFEAIAVSNPSGPAEDLMKQGKTADALALAKKTLGQIDSLYASLKTSQDKWQDGSIVGEMLGRVSQRRVQMSGLVQKLQAKSAGKELTEEQVADIETRQKYNQLLDDCRVYKEQETKLLSAIDARHEGHVGLDETIANTEDVNKLKALYLTYDKAYGELSQLGSIYGFGGKDGKYWRNLKPDKTRFNLALKGKAPSEYSDEEETMDRQQEIESEKLTRSIMANMPASLEAKAEYERQQLIKKNASERAALAAKLRPTLKKARMDALMKAGKCNLYQNKKQDQITKGAKDAWGKAYTKIALAKQKEAFFEERAANKDVYPKVLENVAGQILGMYAEAAELFKKGDLAQG